MVEPALDPSLAGKCLASDENSSQEPPGKPGSRGRGTKRCGLLQKLRVKDSGFRVSKDRGSRARGGGLWLYVVQCGVLLMWVLQELYQPRVTGVLLVQDL